MRHALPTILASLLLASLIPACSDDKAQSDGGPDGGPMDDASSDVTMPPKEGMLPPNPADKVTECMRTIPPPQSGLCDVKAGTKGKLFKGTVLLEREVLHTGEVLVDDDGRITCAACDCSASPDYAQATVVACANGVISPGLINAHDHITYANNGPIGHGMERYEQRHDWRIGKRGHTKITTKSGAPADVVLFAELRFVMSGATSAVSSGGRAGFLRNFDQANPALYQGAPAQQANFDTFPLDDTNGTQNESGCNYGNSATRTSDIAQDEGYLPHIAEGVDKAARNELACTSMGMTDLMQRQTAVIHAIATPPDTAALMRERQTMVVWSPRSNIDLYGNTAPITMLDAEGVPIALGTDWVPSGSINMARELRCADDLNTKYFAKHFSDGDLFRMVTINGAYAAGAQRSLGSLAPGKIADIAIFDGTTNKDHRAVIDAGVEDVALVLRGGQALYGDAALMDGLGKASCESMGDVCGKQRKVCAQADTGSSFATIDAAGSAVYPLKFCKSQPVMNEPSCVPYRMTYAMGITANDKDGDGVDDGADNCPTIFNPVRPMDDGKQADTDGDGLGDSCDVCPRDKTNMCKRPLAGDLDGDGVTDDKDKCPEKADPNQADADGDGVGDACDLCPSFKNPGAVPCPATIPQVRDPMANPSFPDKSIVKVSGYITGGAGDFFIQDTSLAPFTGVQIRSGTILPSTVRGNQVDVEGWTATIFGMKMVIASKITITNNGTALPFSPVVVTPAELKTGGAKAASHQSMLVEIQNLTITNDSPDGSGKFYEFIVNNENRVDDTLYPRYGTPQNGPYPAVGYTNNTTFTKIVGIEGFSFSNAKLWPRDAADIVK